MSFAESNRVQLYYIPEVTWGTTPGSGTVKAVRILSSSIVASKETELSQEIRADRMVPNIIEVSAMTNGEFEYELSAGSFDDFFQQFLLGAWTLPMNHFLLKGAAVTITGTSEITLEGGDYTDYLADNQWLKLDGFTEPQNNAYVSIMGTPSFSGGNTVITVDQTIVVEAGSANTKIFDAGDVIHVGTLVTTSATGNVIDGGGTNPFGDLVVGQRIYMEGLSKETGTVVVGATDPTEGATITVSDGVNTVIFEVRTNSALVTAGNVHVALSGTEATMAGNIETAINAQFAAGNLDVSATVSMATVTLKNERTTGGSIATSDATAFTVTNFSGGVASTQGFFTVASLIDADSFSVEETIATDSNAGGDTVVIKGSHLRNPGTVADITKQSMSVETGFTDVTKYLLHDGLRVGAFSLSVEAGAIVTGNFSMSGSETTTYQATQLGDTGTYTVLDAPGTEVMNATSNVGSVKKDGAALSTSVMSIEISGDNSLREQMAVGSKFPVGIGYGRFTLEGSFEAYFQDFELYNAFLDHDTVSLEFDFTDIDKHVMVFRIPSAKLNSDPIAPGGIDEDIMETIEFSAQRDVTLNTMFMIDRFSSTRPFAAA